MEKRTSGEQKHTFKRNATTHNLRDAADNAWLRSKEEFYYAQLRQAAARALAGQSLSDKSKQWNIPPGTDSTNPSSAVTYNSIQNAVERESVKVLIECIDLQKRKANDYQNARSSITQASYYPQGILTILDILHAKLLRMRSVTEATRDDPSYAPNFESIEDSAKDIINYASFLIAYSRGKIEGQNPDRDFLNRKK